MGGEGGFMQKLMALLGSAGGGAPAPTPSPTPEGKPWEDQSLAPQGGTHMMPGGQMMPDAAMSAPPQSVADDPMALAVKLMRQREMAKRILPEQTWNK